MKKQRIGVVGVGRGGMMFRYCKDADNAELVAICDKWEQGLINTDKELHNPKIKYFTDYDEFLKTDMDIVVLANYATEHAPFAIKAMEAGKNVISEVLPAQTLAQAVALVECIERTGKKYCYAENYCYMDAPREMKKKFVAGELGEFEYGEGEYIHNCESVWTNITYGEEDHWRNNITAFFYCTHSLGPLLHITGLRPVSVTGFELPFNARQARMGAKYGSCAIEMVTLENGSLVKSIHGGLYKDSVWYSVYGNKGEMESGRKAGQDDYINRVFSNIDEVEGDYSKEIIYSYVPEDELAKKGTSAGHGHGGSDYVCLHLAIDYIAGDETADVIDVYEALDMWLPGFFGYLSVLEGGVPQEIPNFRLPEVREKYRNDNRCTDPKIAGDQVLPSYSKGNPEIPQEVYDRRKAEWKKVVEERSKRFD